MIHFFALCIKYHISDFLFFWEMEANTCDVDPPDGSYSYLSCHAIVHKYNWFLKLGEAPNKICTADWLSATSQTDGWCTDNSYHSGSYTLQTGSDANVLRQQIKQWTTVKHELWKVSNMIRNKLKDQGLSWIFVKTLILIKTTHAPLVENTWRCHIFNCLNPSVRCPFLKSMRFC